MSAGYIFDFQDQQYSPEGAVNPPVNVRIHNAVLDAQVIGAMFDGKPVVLYLMDDNRIGTWAGTWSAAIHRSHKSWHNFAGRNGRTDVWFTGPDGGYWHGVNIGDNQIVRCTRRKSRR